MHKFLCLILIWFVFVNAASRDFDGTDDLVDFGDVTIFDGLTSVTCSAWVFADSTAARASVMRKNSSIIPFQIESSTLIRMPVWGSTLNLQNRSHSFLTTRWVHYAARWSTTQNSGNVEYFIDGVSIGSDTQARTGAIANSAVVLRFGATETSTEDYNGRLAHVQYFNRYLSDSEIKELMRKPNSIANGLIAYWPLFGDSTEKNLSGSSLDGTVTNSTASANGPPVFFGNAL